MFFLRIKVKSIKYFVKKYNFRYKKSKKLLNFHKILLTMKNNYNRMYMCSGNIKFPKNFRRILIMKKTELVAAIAEKAALSKKDADKALSAVIDTITAALADGDKIQLVGFGTFEVRSRGARTGKNPRTGEAIKIAASKVPAFKAGRALKDSVNK